MKADYLGFKLADGQVFPLLKLKNQDFSKLELQPADNSMGKVQLHFVLTKHGQIVEEILEPLTLNYDPDSDDDLILHAFRTGKNVISVSLFQKKNPHEASKISIPILSAAEIAQVKSRALQRRRCFLKVALGFFSALALLAALALLLYTLLPTSWLGVFK